MATARGLHCWAHLHHHPIGTVGGPSDHSKPLTGSLETECAEGTSGLLVRLVWEAAATTIWTAFHEDRGRPRSLLVPLCALIGVAFA